VSDVQYNQHFSSEDLVWLLWRIILLTFSFRFALLVLTAAKRLAACNGERKGFPAARVGWNQLAKSVLSAYIYREGPINANICIKG